MGGSATAELKIQQDVNLYKLELLAGETIDVDVDGAAGSSLEPMLRLGVHRTSRDR